MQSGCILLSWTQSGLPVSCFFGVKSGNLSLRYEFMVEAHIRTFIETKHLFLCDLLSSFVFSFQPFGIARFTVGQLWTARVGKQLILRNISRIYIVISSCHGSEPSWQPGIGSWRLILWTNIRLGSLFRLHRGVHQVSHRLIFSPREYFIGGSVT